MRFLLALISMSLYGQADRSHARSMVISQSGIVATSQVLASQAGAQMLARGGSAVDAAIAANAALGVIEPGMCGIGGDLFVLYREARTGELHGLNASGWAPLGMTRERFESRQLKTMPVQGVDAVTVPGCVDGWHRIHQKFGKLPWRDLFAPAIHFAARGFPIQEMDWGHWGSKRALATPEGRQVFQNNGRPYRLGEIARNPDLARALTLIADQGPKAFYRGEIAKALLATSNKLGGVMRADDLAEFASEWVTPIETSYRGWRVVELPPNGQGLAALLMLNLLERFTFAPKQPQVADWHRRIEAMKLAYADAAAYIADPKFAKVPVTGLLSKDYAASRARLMQDRANCNAGPGEPATSDTTYLAVVDKEGNVASWIQSVFSLWGSGIVVEGMGFHLQNRGAGFSLDPRHPNALAPRKRPFHTIIPAYMEKDGRHIGFGIMGGANQPLAHAQFVSNMADYDMNLQAALEAPRFTKSNAQGCNVTIEVRAGAAIIKGLESRGHKLTIRGDHSQSMGRGNAVVHNSHTKVNYGASDSRADGAAIPEPLR
ncbi:MAG: gamma-glutamyltransferase [Acidobacteria bacterium]|nr:gamma-glutamyltransferase [Acidobacteriota bacterium]